MHAHYVYVHTKGWCFWVLQGVRVFPYFDSQIFKIFSKNDNILLLLAFLALLGVSLIFNIFNILARIPFGIKAQYNLRIPSKYPRYANNWRLFHASIMYRSHCLTWKKRLQKSLGDINTKFSRNIYIIHTYKREMQKYIKIILVRPY